MVNKLKTIILVLIITLGAFIGGCSTTKDIDINNYNEYYNIENRTTDELLPEAFIYYSSVPRTPEWANKDVIEAFDKLPDSVKELYLKRKCKIIIIDETLNELDIAGSYYPFYNDIYIKKCVNNLDMTLYHEVGHFFDYKYYKYYSLSDSKEFQAIFYEERYNFKTNHSELWYFQETSREYFAQAFAEYILNSKRLQKNCPETYDFINYYINK